MKTTPNIELTRKEMEDFIMFKAKLYDNTMSSTAELIKWHHINDDLWAKLECNNGILICIGQKGENMIIDTRDIGLIIR